MQPLRVRPAEEGDLDRLIEIHRAAFPDSRTAAERRRNFVAKPFGGFEYLHVVESAGELVAHAFLFPFQVYVGGARVRVGGVATLGVAPEARGRGTGRALMARLHEIALERGDAATFLYPFRQGFYWALGYAPASPLRALSLSPASVPRSLVDRTRIRLRSASGADRGAMEALYLDEASRRTGWLVRPPRLWEHMLSDEARAFLVAESTGERPRPIGYLSTTATQQEPHGETRLRVHEIVAQDEPTRLAIVGELGLFRDQVDQIDVVLDAEDPLDRLLIDADRRRPGTPDVEHAIGLVATGPMLRLLDARRALEARGYPVDGAFDLAVDNAPPFGFLVEGGRGRALPPGGRPRLETSERALAAIAYGGLTASQAHRLGWLRCDGDVVAKATATFSLPPWHTLDPF